MAGRSKRMNLSPDQGRGADLLHQTSVNKFPLATLIGMSLFLAGIYIMSAWVWPFVPTLKLMPAFNTGLLFILSGIALVSINTIAHKLNFLLAATIFSIAAIVGIEYLSGVSFGLNWPNLNPIGGADYLRDRMMPATVAGFLITGTLLVFWRYQSRKALIFTQVLILIVIVNGLVGLIGNVLKLNFVYPWYESVHMSGLTAWGFILLGIGLVFRCNEAGHYAVLLKGRDELRISMVGSVILAIVAIIAGLTGFAVLRQQMETALSNSLELSLKHRSEIFSTTINQAISNISLIASRPNIIHSIRSTDPSRVILNQDLSLDSIAKSFLPLGFSAVTLADAQGNIRGKAGQFTDEHDLKVQLRTSPMSQLLWRNGFFLQVEMDIVYQGQIVGVVQTEAPLSGLTKLLSDFKGFGESAEFAVCAPSTAGMWCFPMRHHDKVISFANKIDGKRLPMSYALAGETGFITAKDYRRRHVVAAFQPVSTLGLGVVLKTDTIELYAPIRNQLQIALPLIFALVILGVTVLYWQVLPLVRRLITSERQAREAGLQLHESETRTRAVINDAMDGIITINDQGIILSFNRAAEKSFGYSASEIIGKNITQLMPEEMRNAHSAGLTRYLTLGAKKLIGKGSIEVPGLRQNGAIFPMEIAINEVESEGQVIFVGILRDISERKRVETDLKASEVRFRTLAIQAPVGIFVTNATGACVYVNERWCEYAGMKSDDALGDGWLKAVHPDDRVDVCATWATAIEKGSAFAMDYRFFTLQENVIWLTGNATPLRDEQGSVRGYVGIVTDITERKNVERLKNEFISTVSHELRTPLTAIRGSLGLLAGGVVGQFTDQAHQLVDIANRNSERLLYLINSILDIEKIEAGKMDCNIQRASLLGVIKQAIEVNQAYALQHQVTLYLAPTTHDAYAMIDTDRLMQVLTNLLSNAAKFSPPNSSVTVRLDQIDQTLRVSVIDQGPGIPAEFHGRIFEKFAQADSSDSRRKGGTGLGLSIAKAIMERLDGKIGFVSKENEGATFYIELPQIP